MMGCLPNFFVDVWSDVVCPFCYLGFASFTTRSSDFETPTHVVVRHHAFELDPARATGLPGSSLDEMLATKYAMPVEQAHGTQRAGRRQRARTRHDVVARARPTHQHLRRPPRRSPCAATQGRQDEMLERLFRAYFSEGRPRQRQRHPHDTRDSRSGSTGVERMLAGDEFADEVRHDEHLAAKIGITGVPALIFDGSRSRVGRPGR